MKKRLSVTLAVVLGLIPLVCMSQSSDVSWPDLLNTAKNVDYLTLLEKEIIHEMNKVRTNPKVYAQYIRQHRAYYSSDGSLIERPGEIPIRTKEGFKAVDECIAELENAQPVGILQPEEALSKASVLLAQYQSETGERGHVGPDGMSMKQRIEQFGDSNRWIAENCSYGNNDARRIVIQLLIDDGVASRGHRENMLNAKYVNCGVSINTHPVYRYLCVIDYASE